MNEGYVLPCVALGRVRGNDLGRDPGRSDQVAALFAVRGGAAGEQSRRRTGPRSRRGRKALIDGDLRAAYAKHLAWYTGSYKPKCNTAVGASALPGGKAFYDYRIRNQTTTNRTADDIHALGLSEVKRIRAEMETVAKKAGFPSREAIIADLRTNPKYYAKTPEELMQAVARETKRIDGKMPTLFTLLPRLPYGIREIPAETAEGTTTAYYNQRLARERHCRHLLRQHVEARPAAVVGSPGADGARGGARPSPPDRAAAGTADARRGAATAPSSPPSSKAGGSIRSGSGSRWACTTRRPRTWGG